MCRSGNRLPRVLPKKWILPPKEQKWHKKWPARLSGCERKPSMSKFKKNQLPEESDAPLVNLNKQCASSERWKDPDAWKCLDDTQRDIINDWYNRILQSNKETCKEERKISRYAAATIIVPLSVWYAISGIVPVSNIFIATLKFIGALFFFLCLSCISYAVGDYACRDGFNRIKIFCCWSVYGIAVFLILAKVYA